MRPKAQSERHQSVHSVRLWPLKAPVFPRVNAGFYGFAAPRGHDQTWIFPCEDASLINDDLNKDNRHGEDENRGYSKFTCSSLQLLYSEPSELVPSDDSFLRASARDIRDRTARYLRKADTDFFVPLDLACDLQIEQSKILRDRDDIKATNLLCVLNCAAEQKLCVLYVSGLNRDSISAISIDQSRVKSFTEKASGILNDSIRLASLALSNQVFSLCASWKPANKAVAVARCMYKVCVVSADLSDNSLQLLAEYQAQDPLASCEIAPDSGIIAVATISQRLFFLSHYESSESIKKLYELSFKDIKYESQASRISQASQESQASQVSQTSQASQVPQTSQDKSEELSMVYPVKWLNSGSLLVGAGDNLISIELQTSQHGNTSCIFMAQSLYSIVDGTQILDITYIPQFALTCVLTASDILILSGGRPGLSIAHMRNSAALFLTVLSVQQSMNSFVLLLASRDDLAISVYEFKTDLIRLSRTPYLLTVKLNACIQQDSELGLAISPLVYDDGINNDESSRRLVLVKNGKSLSCAYVSREPGSQSHQTIGNVFEASEQHDGRRAAHFRKLMKRISSEDDTYILGWSRILEKVSKVTHRARSPEKTGTAPASSLIKSIAKRMSRSPLTKIKDSQYDGDSDDNVDRETELTTEFFQNVAQAIMNGQGALDTCLDKSSRSRFEWIMNSMQTSDQMPARLLASWDIQGEQRAQASARRLPEPARKARSSAVQSYSVRKESNQSALEPGQPLPVLSQKIEEYHESADELSQMVLTQPERGEFGSRPKHKKRRKGF